MNLPSNKFAGLWKLLAAVFFAFATSILLSGPLLISVDDAQPSDAIIVIGGDHKPERVRRAVELYQMGLAPRIIISGGTMVLEGDQELAEAEVMRRQALSMGLAQTAITIEARSESTFENAYYSKQICQENGIQSILLVTSALHSKRAKMLFQAVMDPDITVRVQPAIEPCELCRLVDPGNIYVVFYEYQNWIHYWFEHIGNFFIPLVSMPIYYYLFIWLDRPPDWALNPVPPPTYPRSSRGDV